MVRPELFRVYGQFLKAIMTLLYDFDLDGIGRSIDAPADEYHDLATLLIPPLSRARTASEAADEIHKLIPAAESPLIEALWGAQLEFKHDEAGPKRPI